MITLCGISELLRRVKQKLRGRRSFLMRDQKRYARYQIGPWTYGEPDVQDFAEGSTLRIGAYCCVARDTVILLGGEHRSDFVSMYPFSVYWFGAELAQATHRSRGDVTIGNDVWVGNGAMILSGVSIGDGAVIGARSVVRTSVEPYAIVAGQPARVVGYRFSAEQRESLLRIAWWNWPVDVVRQRAEDLASQDIDGFIRKYGRTAGCGLGAGVHEES